MIISGPFKRPRRLIDKIVSDESQADAFALSGKYFILSCENDALNNISFRIGKGQKVALMGPSGSGKTTIFQLICFDIFCA